jgi:hypothetical protein
MSEQESGGNATEQLPPFVIEGARSSRSRCKTCRRKINKDTLRIGMLIEGPYGTGYLWHHLTCAARKRFERVAEAYRLEAWKEAKQPPAKVPPLDDLRKTSEQSAQRARQRRDLPYAELDPSGRAKCKHCAEPLDKGGVRIVMGRNVEFGNQVRVGPVNVHPRCVASELASEECAIEADGLEAALRANTRDVPADLLDAALAEIG